MVMIHGVSTLERPGRRFISLRPRLLKCSMLDIESMGTSLKHYLPVEPRLESENHGGDIRA